MYILLVLLISVLIALLRGGRLEALAGLKFRCLWLFFAPLALQLMVFSPLGSLIGNSDLRDELLYIASIVLGGLVLILNRHIPGASWIAVGLALNLVVIIANGGVMPVWTDARQLTGMPPLTGRDNNVVPMTSTTLLPWLADVIPVPGLPYLRNVFSIGDLLIAVGAVLFTQRALFTSHPASPRKNSASVEL